MAYSLTDPGFIEDPSPTLAKMRAEGALVRAKVPFIGEVYLTTTDAAARRVLKDGETFVRNPASIGERSYDKIMWWMPGFMRPLMQSMLLHDGAEHKRLRGLVEQAFARHAMLDMRPQIDANADALLDAIDTAQPVDIVSAYCRPLPLLVICDLLGIRPEDRDKVQRWIAPISAPINGIAMVRAFPGFYRLIRYFRREFEAARREGYPPGLIRELVAAEQDGDKLTEDELMSMVVTLFIAGHETTVHLISNAILGCIDSGSLGPELAADPKRLPIAIEEFMRHVTPVMMTKTLFVAKDTDFDGTQLVKGDKIVNLLVGANRDPARFDDPDTHVPDRRPNAHLGFGHGPHVCLGMQLARMEAGAALERLFARYPNTEFAVPRDQIKHSRRIGLRGIPKLPLNLRA